MTTPVQQPPMPSPMKKFGPLIGIVLVLVVIAGVVIIAGRGNNSSNNAQTGGTTGGGAPTSPSDAALTYQQAKAQGKEGSTTWVDNCDPATGRIKVPSQYAPPCVPKFTGDNGGATGTGVTADKIVIVNYVPPTNNDLLTMFTAQLDPPEKTKDTAEKFKAMFDNLYATYGRKVEIVDYNAAGAPDDAVAAQADAQNVVDKYHPFASLGGPILTKAYAEELAHNKVLCLGCGAALPDQFYQDNSPYIWGYQPTPEEFLVNLGDFITNRVANRPASFAGDELKNQTRKFGVVHFEQNPPVFNELADEVAKCGQMRGYETGATETYLFEMGSMPDRATTIIAKMKAAGVTSIIFLGDPIMPIYLTKQATAQNYYPEWIFTGTVLTDTTVLGRLYDQDQMKHAYGLSNLPARIPREQGDSWKMYTWYYGDGPQAANTQAIIYQPLQLLYMGIHMAGPKLSADTFKQGLFNYPETGGGPTVPHLSFGNHGYFTMPKPGDNCVSTTPRTDYLGSDDVTEIWWDATAKGKDEQGKDGTGMWRYANGGKRYLPGTMPKTDTDAFKMDGSVTIIDQQPPGDKAPEYPPPTKPATPTP